MIPVEAVEEVAAILYDIGEHQNTHTFEAVHDMLREDAKRILEATAPFMQRVAWARGYAAGFIDAKDDKDYRNSERNPYGK